MDVNRILILPGLDGSDSLLEPFANLAPDNSLATVIPLGQDSDGDYATEASRIAEILKEVGPCHIVAESFSGPIGIMLAFNHPSLVRRLTLVASFATSPVPRVGWLAPWRLLFCLPLPVFVARHWFVGGDPEMAIKVRTATSDASSRLLAKRMRCLMSVNVSTELKALGCPIQYIRPTKDRLVSRRSVDIITQLNPAVEVREIDGPHLILQTCPQVAWATIIHD